MSITTQCQRDALLLLLTGACVEEAPGSQLRSGVPAEDGVGETPGVDGDRASSRVRFPTLSCIRACAFQILCHAYPQLKPQQLSEQ